jgi:hypothetical protein
MRSWFWVWVPPTSSYTYYRRFTTAFSSLPPVRTWNSLNPRPPALQQRFLSLGFPLYHALDKQPGNVTRGICYQECPSSSILHASSQWRPGWTAFYAFSLGAEILMFKIFTAQVIICNTFVTQNSPKPDIVSLHWNKFRFSTVMKLWSLKLEDWPPFIFCSGLWTMNRAAR